MKTLAVPRPLILIMVGLPGSGKSFFARQFADMFSAPLIHYDRLQYELFAEPSFSTNEHELLQRLAHYQIQELLKTKRSFIVDGGQNTRQDRVALEELARKHGYNTLVIWVQTDDPTAKMRSLRRNPKHIDDVYKPKIAESQFAMLSKRLVTPTRESYVVISGKHAFSTQAKMVLRKLSAPHLEQVAAAQTKDPAPKRPLQPQARPDVPPANRRSVIIS